jgi:hypothetical protein
MVNSKILSSEKQEIVCFRYYTRFFGYIYITDKEEYTNSSFFSFETKTNEIEMSLS